MEYNRACERHLPCLIFLLQGNEPAPLLKQGLSKEETSLARFKKRLMAEHKVHSFRLPEDLRQQLVDGLMRTTLYFALPLRRNPWFVGREPLLAQIHQRLVGDAESSGVLRLPLALVGVAGTGKTTVAREYAGRFRQYYQQVLWVRAESHLFVFEFARLAQELRLIERPSADAYKDAQRALSELTGRKRCLLILDGADDEESVRAWLPQGGGSRVLITSRFMDWSRAVQTVPVEVLEPEPARQLLLLGSGRVESEASARAADRVAAALGYFPPALEQAAAFLRAAGLTLDQYLPLFNEAELAVAQSAGTNLPPLVRASILPHPLAVTWRLGQQRLGPMAQTVLRLIAFLAADPIPVQMLEEAGDLLRAGLAEVAEAQATEEVEFTPWTLRTQLNELADASLVAFRGDLFSVHRLVQQLQQESLDVSGRRSWAWRTVVLVERAFPRAENWDWEICDRLLAHAFATARLIQEWQFDFAEAVALLDRLGLYLKERDRHTQAVAPYQRALAIRRTTLGEEHPDCVQSTHVLAEVYRVLEDFAAAEPLLRQALDSARAILGEGHPDVAERQTDLALLYVSMKKPAQAEPLLEQALTLWRAAFGEEHPKVATALDNLGRVHLMQCDTEQAEPLFQRALAIRRKILGERHADVASSLNHLAELHQAAGRYRQAEPLLQQALAIQSSSLGENHPALAQIFSNLAQLHQATGNYDQAELFFRQALALRREAYGEAHPDFVRSLHGLATLYQSMARYDQAESLYRQALRFQRADLGDNHPDVAQTLASLAGLYEAQNDFAQAEVLYRQALAIRRQSLGEEHLEVAQTLSSLAALYEARGDQGSGSAALSAGAGHQAQGSGARGSDVCASFAVSGGATHEPA
jgi:tetratricopeptide (TPR) repeat protein